MLGFIHISHIFPNEMAQDLIPYSTLTEVSAGAVRSIMGFNSGIPSRNRDLKGRETPEKLMSAAFILGSC